MTVVSSKEFVTNQEKYFDLAVNEDVAITRGKNMFHLVCTTVDNSNKYDEILEPDEDFYRAISMDEFIERAVVMAEKVDKMYAEK